MDDPAWRIRRSAGGSRPTQDICRRAAGKNYGLLTILQTDYKLSKDSQVEAGVAVQRERPRDRRGQRS
jgi:hypothetical protein